MAKKRETEAEKGGEERERNRVGGGKEGERLQLYF